MNKYVLRYTADEAKNPLLAEAVLKTGVMVNILTADVEYSKGVMVVSVLGDETQQKKLVEYLREKGVEVEKLEAKVLKDDDRCVDCCACYGVCPTKAITIKDNKMVLDNDECIRCGACVEVCPTRARVFGDLADERSDAARLIERYDGWTMLPEKGTQPRVYYIG